MIILVLGTVHKNLTEFDPNYLIYNEEILGYNLISTSLSMPIQNECENENTENQQTQTNTNSSILPLCSLYNPPKSLSAFLTNQTQYIDKDNDTNIVYKCDGGPKCVKYIEYCHGAYRKKLSSCVCASQTPFKSAPIFNCRSIYQGPYVLYCLCDIRDNVPFANFPTFIYKYGKGQTKTCSMSDQYTTECEPQCNRTIINTNCKITLDKLFIYNITIGIRLNISGGFIMNVNTQFLTSPTFRGIGNGNISLFNYINQLSSLRKVYVYAQEVQQAQFHVENSSNINTNTYNYTYLKPEIVKKLYMYPSLNSKSMIGIIALPLLSLALLFYNIRVYQELRCIDEHDYILWLLGYHFHDSKDLSQLVYNYIGPRF
jgi:hypothetical protein